jgi:hypothetical protein
LLKLLHFDETYFSLMLLLMTCFKLTTVLNGFFST